MKNLKQIDLIGIRKSILEEIEIEREAQNQKHGQQEHGFADWQAIAHEEVGEANQQYLWAKFEKTEQRQVYREKMREELIQATAVLVAQIECIDRHACDPDYL